MKSNLKKILAIDDIEDNILVLKGLILEEFPSIKFISASNGIDGLALANREKPDVLLLDIVMQGMDGYEVCSTMKTDKLLKYIPIVMVTAIETDLTCRIKALECGADGFLTKPVDKSELIAQVRAMLRLKDAEDRKQNEKQRLEEMIKQRTRDLLIELRQRKKAEKELKVAFDELERKRKTESALFVELKAQMQVRREAEFALLQSRKAFQNYFENSAVGMSVTLPDKRWIEVNQSFCRMLGYSKAELEIKNWVDVTYPEDIAYNLELFEQVSAGKLDRFEIDKRFVRKDGSQINVALSVVAQRNSDGSLNHLLTSYVDVTERYLAEEAIKQERSLLRTLVDNLPVIIYIKDSLGRKMVSNKSDLDYMGYELESQVIGKTDIELFVSDDGVRKYEEDMSVLQTGIPLINREMSYVDTKGKRNWRLSSKIPVYDENQKVRGLVGIGYDITERKLIEEALRTSEELFRNLVENIPDGIYKSTIEGKFLSVNPALVTMLGYESSEELMAIDVHDLYFNREDRNRLLKNPKEGGFSTFKLKRKDGLEIWAEDHCWTNMDEDGNIVHYIGILRDVTERMRIESELKILSRAVEQNPASILITNTLGQIKYVNPKFTALTGYTLLEALGENPSILKSGFTTKKEYADLWNTILAGGEWHGEFQNKKKNGEYYFENVIISAIKDDNGDITHFLAVKEDITSQKKDETLIRKLSKAIGQSPVSTIITDSQGKIEFVNKAFTELTQYEPDEVINKTPRLFNRGHLPEIEYEFMWKNLTDGKVWRGEYENVRKDATKYWEDATISPLLNSKGEISNYILILINISEQKKMFDELIAAKESAEESNRLKSSFLATMNHELRTPLNHIIGFSEMILMGVAPEDNISYASSIQASGQNMLSMVEGVFEFALAEHTNIKLRTQKYSLIDQFMENKASFDHILKASAKHEQIQLVFKPDSNWLSGYIIADRSKINQVLNNVFKNAVKFTESGTIEFGYVFDNELDLTFYIKDTGIGIPPEKQEIIFDFFRQGDDSFTKVYGGVGIGLAISKKITKILKGELTVVSEPGKGSTFSLRVPVELADGS